MYTKNISLLFVSAPEVNTSLVNPIIKDSGNVSAPSLFHNHLLIPAGKPTLHFTNYDFGIAGLIFFLYALYVWLFVFYRKRLTQIINGFYINRYANQLVREEFTLRNRASVFLEILFVFTLTLFITQLNEYYGFITDADNTLYLIVAVTIIITYSIKLIGIKLLGAIFQMQREANEYRMSISLFAYVLGLFLFPVVTCLVFVKQASPWVFIYMGIGIIAVFLLVRLVRGLMIGLNSHGVSKFYLFLYLCTLEILPFVIAIKLFTLYIK